jgi:prevent-host-death family protein
MCKIHKIRKIHTLDKGGSIKQMQRIRKTDLARKTHQVIRTVQRGESAVIENHGEEEAVILDILDYRILRAVMHYYAHPMELRDNGLSEYDLKRLADSQSRWDLVLAHYLAEGISLARAAELLDLSSFELRTRFQRLEVPLRMGASDISEVQSDLDTARVWARPAKK